MNKVDILNDYLFTDTIPSVYDNESATCLEMVAKLHGVVKNLQESYNSLVDEVNKTINDFINSTERNQEEFENSINKIMHDYIHSIDTKIDLQDSKLNEAIEYMENNLSSSITSLLNEMKVNGEIDEALLNSFNNLDNRVKTIENTVYSLEYEEDTENLILVKTVKDGE